MIEFTRVLHVGLVKSDLVLEQELAGVLGGEEVDPKEFYRNYLDDGLLDHFSSSWVVEAPLSVWRELDILLACTPMDLTYDAEVFYVPDATDAGLHEEAVIEHIERNTIEAHQRYQNLLILGLPDSVSELVIPSNLMLKRLVTMTALEVVNSLRCCSEGDFSAATSVILSGIGRVFDECSPIIKEILEEDDAFTSN